MSPLWSNNKVKKLQINNHRPSPKYNSDYHHFAQSVLFRRVRQESQSFLICDAIKGISLFTSPKRKIRASMTVEAAVVLPLFLFFFLNLGAAIEIIRLHGNIEFALCDVGNQISVYGHALSVKDSKSEKSGAWAEVKDLLFSYSYIKNEMKSYMGEEYLENSPVVNGADGLVLLESEIFDQEDNFEIVVTYQVAPFSEAAGFRSFRMANKYYGRMWTGYEIPGTEEGEFVYVTKYGVCFHEDRSCAYIDISVRSVSLREAYVCRNSDGEKYKPCLLCAGPILNDSVYITDGGNSIHNRENCPGINRTVYEVSKTEAGGYDACTRCVKEW